MTARDDLHRLAVYVCPQGRLCECNHPGDDQFCCPHCGCDCPLPTEDERSGNPDACPCCGRDMDG